MKPELFDIVDENNNPLGTTKERFLVHKDGDWHNSVHIYVLNDGDEFLVHLRAPFKDLYPNCWDTRFGGHVLAGDTIENTAARELEEEAGIKVKNKDLAKGMIYKYDGKTNREFNPVYYYKFREGDIIKFNDNEVVEVKWMSLDEILKSLKNNPKKWSTRISTVKKIYEYWKELKNMKKGISDWLSEFEKNWKSKNVDGIIGLFDENVVYYEAPSQRLNSLQEIRKEWNLIKEQNEINLKFDIINKIGEKYTILWELSFLDNQKKIQNFKGKYEIILNNKGICVEFRQYENGK